MKNAIEGVNSLHNLEAKLSAQEAAKVADQRETEGKEPDESDAVTYREDWLKSERFKELVTRAKEYKVFAEKTAAAAQASVERATEIMTKLESSEDAAGDYEKILEAARVAKENLRLANEAWERIGVEIGIVPVSAEADDQ